MKRRPWPIVILALLQVVIEPVSNLFLNSYWSHVTPGYYLRWFAARHDWLSLFYVFGLPPIMGAAVYAMKRWSYALFFGGATWMLIQNFAEVRSGQMLWPVAVGLYLGNLAFVGYFLLPTVVETFWNPKLRWWEIKPRFQVEYDGTLEGEAGALRCRIKNLSEGGAYVTCPETLRLDEEMSLGFTPGKERSVSTRIRVVFHRAAENGYGIRFIETGPDDRKAILKLVRELHKAGVPVQNRAPGSSWQDFRHWFRRLARTGKGLVPEWDRVEPRLLPASDRVGYIDQSPGPQVALSPGDPEGSDPVESEKKKAS